jgi:hypothetical protein
VPKTKTRPVIEAVRTVADTVPPDNRTIGWQALEWTTTNLLQPDGPRAGQPWIFTDEQVRIVLRWYEIDPLGSFVHRRGVLRRMKGWGKDPFAVALACIEFLGPCRFAGWDDNGLPMAQPVAVPLVQICGVSKSQSKTNTFGLFQQMMSPQCLSDYSVDIGKEIIYSNRGQIQAVTSSPSTMEGARSTFVVLGESHLWMEGNEGFAMAKVIRRNLAKNPDGSARSLEITNSHLPGQGSVGEESFEAWRKSDGRLVGVYYDALEAPVITKLGPDDTSKVPVPLADLDDHTVQDLLAAARGDSEWLDLDRLLAEIRDPTTTETEARRFYLNQVTAQGVGWLPDGAWANCTKSRAVPDGTEVVLGFDGSLNQDSTALVVVTVEEQPYVDVVGLWERPDASYQTAILWTVPRDEVKQTIRDACARWKVREVAADQAKWITELQELADEGIPVVRFPQTSEWMGPATQRLYELITGGGLSHSGHPALARHMANARTKQSGRHMVLTKDGPSSPRKIDLAVCTVMAIARATALYRAPTGVGVFSVSDIDPEEMAAMMEMEMKKRDEVMAQLMAEREQTMAAYRSAVQPPA